MENDVGYGDDRNVAENPNRNMSIPKKKKIVTRETRNEKK